MKNFNVKFLLPALFLGGIFLNGCTSEEDVIKDPVMIAPSSQGVFVTNEGQFNKGNGSLSYINFQSKTVSNDLFEQANGRPLGDVVQSMGIANGKAYIVVNHSNKLEIADASTLQAAGVINNLLMPRYFATAGGKGYVTEYVSYTGNGQVSVIDLNTNAVIKTIPVGAMPERMLAVNNKLYVVNSDGNTVSVINTQTDAVESTITVGDGPNSLALDASNKLWVLCGGNKVYDPVTYQVDENASTAGSLVRVNLNGNTVEQTLTFASKKALPADLNRNASGNSFVYSYQDKVYRIESGATTLPTAALINRSFYGLGVDPNDNSIFGSLAGNFIANGKVIHYTPAGAATDSFTVGIAPNNFFFK